MRYSLFIPLVFFAFASFAQEIDEPDYVSEFTWGVNKNTNSGVIGGIAFKLARRNSDRIMNSYGLEFLNVKHPKEYRYYGNTTGTYFVWGKQNYLYSIRANYGRERLLFKKAQQQGVQISTIVAAGPTMGLIVPYYVQISDGSYQPFDPAKQTQDGVIGKGKLFQGLGDADVTVGLNAKVGLSFEFGSFKSSVAGVESGFALEAFPQKIVIVPTQKNRAIFPSLYFTLYWGHRK